MIENYIEKDIKRKLAVIDLLTADHFPVPELAKKLFVTRATIRADLDEIQTMLSGEKKVFSSEESDSYVYNAFRDNNEVIRVKKLICKKSIFLQMLVFYLRNNRLEYNRFIQNFYISSSYFYQVRAQIEKYINDIDFIMGKNGLEGDEVRIRFFYTYIQIRTGLEIVDIDESIFWRLTIKKANEYFSLNFSKLTSEYATLLFTFAKIRSNKKLLLKPKFVNSIKKFPFYKKIKEDLIDHFGKDATDEFIYFTIIVLNFLESDGFSELTINMTISPDYAIFLNEHGRELVDILQSKYSFNSYKYLSLFVLSFLKKAYFNLQPLLPEKEIFINDEDHQLFYDQIIEILDKWNENLDIPYKFTKIHLDRFAFQLQQILSPRTTKIIKIVANNYYDLFIIEQQLLKRFGKYGYVIDNIAYPDVKSAVDAQLNPNDYFILKIDNSFVEDYYSGKEINLLAIPLSLTEDTFKIIKKLLDK